jgi:predicted O-methyltransferase YrrM
MKVLQKLRDAISQPHVSQDNSGESQVQGLEKELSARIRHYLPSFLLSLDDEPYKPSDRLINLMLGSVKRAWEDEMLDLQKRFDEPDRTYIKTFPGEHYRLLKAIVQEMRPKTVIEIGTYRGLGCLTLKSGLADNSKLITYDIFPWNEIPGTHLKESDWDEKMEFRQKDLCNPIHSAEEMADLVEADLIFVDAAKDGKMEREFISLFMNIPFRNPPIVIFDDIRFPEMCLIWRDITKPKLDVTSFGHWSGTGLVDWV